MPHEECGVWGVFVSDAKRDVARLTCYALASLQHRGQESTGIVTCNGRTSKAHKGMGLVTQVFPSSDEEVINRLLCLESHFPHQHLQQHSSSSGCSRGLISHSHVVHPSIPHEDPHSGAATHAIGHNRYSTSGSSEVRFAQPFYVDTRYGPFAVAHNGNLVNSASLRNQIIETDGVELDTDSQMIAHILSSPVLAVRWAESHQEASSAEKEHAYWESRIRMLMDMSIAAYSVVVLTRDSIYGFRDRLGMRPLVVGALQEIPGTGGAGYAISSESCAMSTIGARYMREVLPGEIVRISKTGVQSLNESELLGPPERPLAFCVFEYIYFSRPDSLIKGHLVHKIRQQLGRRLFEEDRAREMNSGSKLEADIVVGVPDSATAAAIGYALASGIPFTEGLSKNQHIGRTFIQPDEHSRKSKVDLKYNCLAANVQNQRVILVDDSIVRGHSMRALVRIFKEEGQAQEVHVRIASPPVKHPCYMGVDMSTYDELIANQAQGSVDRIREFIGADSLEYLSLDGLLSEVGQFHNNPVKDEKQRGLCAACFTGQYPTELEW